MGLTDNGVRKRARKRFYHINNELKLYIENLDI